MKKQASLADKLLEIGIALSGEKNPNRLLRTILNAAMDITNCDGGTLYTVEGEALEFKIMVTESMGVDKSWEDGTINLPPVPLRPENVCARSALDKSLIIVPDVYNDERFDFSGPQRYDKMTGYRTMSMMVVPMQDDYGDVIGVLQLINALDSDNEIVPFDEGYRPVILSLASQAAIRLTNMNYSEEIIETLDSFVRVMSTAIDARSPYNANHTRNMVKYGERFLNYLASIGYAWQPDEQERRQFLMSVWLHDVGKLVIPLEVMDKQDRLGSARSEVENRFRTIGLLDRIACLEGKIEDYDRRAAMLAEAQALIGRANTAGFLPDDMLAAIDAIAGYTYVDEHGETKPWLTAEEHVALSVRKGTLTGSEREIIESHVGMTGKMLSEMNFSRSYKKVPEWAAAHHEFLNGKGYPMHRQGDEIPKEVRLLTILDIFDALTARDRPYKPALPMDRALGILDEMVKDGQLDEMLVSLFRQSEVWQEEQ